MRTEAGRARGDLGRIGQRCQSKYRHRHGAASDAGAVTDAGTGTGDAATGGGGAATGTGGGGATRVTHRGRRRRIGTGQGHRHQPHRGNRRQAHSGGPRPGHGRSALTGRFVRTGARSLLAVGHRGEGREGPWSLEGRGAVQGRPLPAVDRGPGLPGDGVNRVLAGRRRWHRPGPGLRPLRRVLEGAVLLRRRHRERASGPEVLLRHLDVV